MIVDDKLIDVEPGDTTERRHAIAFDLGTTTVVATLLDLSSARPLAVRSMLNKQQPYGADVISRISATMMDDTRSAPCSAWRTRRSTSWPRRSARRPTCGRTRSTRSRSPATRR